MTKILTGFPPIATSSATILILGSMPSVESLRQHQYYAHKRNAFWRIMAAMLGFDASLSYRERASQLKGNDIALWDVIKTCERSGSLDTKIKNTSIEINDFATFFRKHPHIRKICFNGSMAEQQFRKHVIPILSEEHSADIVMIRLPSTSPAMATLSFDKKLAAWSKTIRG
jgi:double-stranded uracil-DNA glycosylase